MDAGLNNPRHNGRILRKIYLIFYNASVFNDLIRKVKDGIRPDCIRIQPGICCYLKVIHQAHGEVFAQIDKIPIALAILVQNA